MRQYQALCQVWLVTSKYFSMSVLFAMKMSCVQSSPSSPETSIPLRKGLLSNGSLLLIFPYALEWCGPSYQFHLQFSANSRNVENGEPSNVIKRSETTSNCSLI